LLGLAGWRTPAARSIFALTPAEREYLSYRDDRSEFAEWITAIRLPESVHKRPEAEASSLRDLVDFAIDNDTGVVEDPGTGAYHAVTDEFVYTYAPPTLAVEGGDGNEETEGETTAGVAGDDEAIDTDETADVSAATDDDGAWVGADVNSAQTSDGRGSEAADSEPSDGAN